MPINTKQAERRRLRFQTLRDILAEAERLAEADAAGMLRRTGNWTTAQNLWHVAYFIDRCAGEGFPFTLPWKYRGLGYAIKPITLIKQPPRGRQIPADIARYCVAPADMPLEEALDYLRSAIAKADRPGAMHHPHPFAGRLSHDQWVKAHCRHAEMHFSFLFPGTDEEKNQ